MLRDAHGARADLRPNHGGLCLALRQLVLFAFVMLALVMLLLPALAFAQDTRAGAIAAEQAEKATRLAPQQPHWAEKLVLTVAQDARRAALGLLSVLRQRLQRRRVHARRRVSPVHRRSHARGTSPGLYSVEGLQADRGRRHVAGSPVGPPRSSRHRAAGGTPRRWPITGSASTAPPTPTPRFACSRPTPAAT